MSGLVTGGSGDNKPLISKTGSGRALLDSKVKKDDVRKITMIHGLFERGLCLSSMWRLYRHRAISVPLTVKIGGYFYIEKKAQ